MSELKWRGQLRRQPADGQGIVVNIQDPQGLASVVNEFGVTLEIKDGELVVNDAEQVVQTEEILEEATSNAEGSQEVIYIKPDGGHPDGIQGMTLNASDLEGATVVKQQHIPVSDSVWESIQSAVSEGGAMSNVNFEELLKGSNVLIQVAGQEEVKQEEDEDGEEVTYLVIEPQMETTVESEETIVIESSKAS